MITRGRSCGRLAISVVRMASGCQDLYDTVEIHSCFIFIICYSTFAILLSLESANSDDLCLGLLDVNTYHILVHFVHLTTST